MILQVALDTPLRRLFDYLPPPDWDASSQTVPEPGIRVQVPFGRRQLVGVLVAVSAESALPRERLRAASQLLDAVPVFDPATFGLLLWSADYYHHPIGEVFAAALPASLRAGQAAREAPVCWTLTTAGAREHAAPTSRRASRARALLDWFATVSAATEKQLPAGFGRTQLRTLAARGWIALAAAPAAALPAGPRLVARRSEVTPSPAQTAVVDAITATLGSFAAHLLYGVTGSGKTEVYLLAIAACLERGGQALVLVPEIALTPQLVARFEARFDRGVAVLHSGLTGRQRRDAWRAALGGEARIVIGTRSAVFTPLPALGLLIVDEEHDASYKQHEGFRYSARDLAVLRAQRAGAPVVLGSATPSLESLENAAQGRYAKWVLPQRAGNASAPRMSLVDLRQHASDQGLSQPALQAIGAHLQSGGQVIVFLNRRGYAPTLFCTQCGWVAPCKHCDARLTLHQRAGELRCHHCGAREALLASCGRCAAPLRPIGQGTERVEETLARLFPAAPLARLDRDTAGGRGELEAVLASVHSGAARILVGTQMLTKGHHFPDVSLVVILDADQGLFATDYRATERLAQTIIQVAGRAGRAARPGEVLIQTAFPDHPLLQRLISAGYDGFATSALEERREAAWPPFARLALLRAEAREVTRLDAFLNAAAELARPLQAGQVQVLGPANALLSRRADHFRAHLLIEAVERPALQRFLVRWIRAVESLPAPGGLRWSLDVDPLEVD